MSGFGTGYCGICNQPCHELDDFCSDLCQEEADRRGEEEQEATNKEDA